MQQPDPSIRIRTVAIDKFGNSYLEYDGMPLLFCYDPNGSFIYLCNFDIRFVSLVYLRPGYGYVPVAAPQTLPTLGMVAREIPESIDSAPPASYLSLSTPKTPQWQRLEDTILPIRMKPARPAPPPRITTTGFTYRRDDIAPLALPPCAKASRSAQKQRRAARKKAAAATPPARSSKFDAAIAEVARLYPATPRLDAEPPARRPASREQLTYNMHRYNLAVRTYTRGDTAGALDRYGLDTTHRNPNHYRHHLQHPTAEAESRPRYETDLAFITALFEGSLARRDPCETQGVIIVARDNLAAPRLPVTHIGDRIVLTVDPNAPRRLGCTHYEFTAVCALYVHDSRLRHWVFRMLLRYIASRGYKPSTSKLPTSSEIRELRTFWTVPAKSNQGYSQISIVLRGGGAYRTIILWGAIPGSPAASIIRHNIITITQSMIMDAQAILAMFNAALARACGINVPSSYYKKRYEGKPFGHAVFAMETDATAMFTDLRVPSLANSHMTMADHTVGLMRHSVETMRLGPRCREAILAAMAAWQDTFRLMCRGPIILALDDVPEFLTLIYRLHAQQIERLGEALRLTAACRTPEEVTLKVAQIRQLLTWQSP